MGQLSGRGVKVDVLEQAQSDPDYRVVVSDFEAHEWRHGEIPKDSISSPHSHWTPRALPKPDTLLRIS